MKKLYLKIAEHNISVECNLSSAKYFFENFNIVSDVIGIEPDISLKVIAGHGTPFSNYNVDISETRDLITYERTDYKIEVNHEFTHATIMVYDDFALKHALINLYSSLIVHRKWGLLIHSSCVLESGKAHVFAGKSGAGKSTVAELSSPRDILSDEATIVKIDKNNISIFNSPFRSENTAKSNYEPYNLSSIQILHQDSLNRVEKVTKADAIFLIMDKIFFWRHSTKEVEVIYHLLKLITEKIEINKLYFQKNNEFWELIS